MPGANPTPDPWKSHSATKPAPEKGPQPPGKREPDSRVRTRTENGAQGTPPLVPRASVLCWGEEAMLGLRGPWCCQLGSGAAVGGGEPAVFPPRTGFQRPLEAEMMV